MEVVLCASISTDRSGYYTLRCRRQKPPRHFHSQFRVHQLRVDTVAPAHRRKQRAGSSSSSCRCDDGTICLSCALCNCMHIIGRPIMNQTVCSRPHVTTIQYESAQCVYYVKKREREIRRSIKVNAFEFQFIFLCVCCCNDWPTPSSSVWKFLLTCCEEEKLASCGFCPAEKDVHTHSAWMGFRLEITAV